MKRLSSYVGMCLLAFGSLAFLAGCGSSYSSPSSPSTPATPAPSSGSADVSITISGIEGNMSFSPDAASVKVGQTVAWTNADSIAHAIAGDDGVSTSVIGPGTTSAPVKITAAGTLNYHCSIHPSMTGTLVVSQ